MGTEREKILAELAAIPKEEKLLEGIGWRAIPYIFPIPSRWERIISIRLAEARPVDSRSIYRYMEYAPELRHGFFQWKWKHRYGVDLKDKRPYFSIG